MFQQTVGTIDFQIGTIKVLLLGTVQHCTVIQRMLMVKEGL